MHYTHCIKQGPHSIFHITTELDLAMHSAVYNKQITGRGWEQARKCGENQGAWGVETEREQGREHCVPESEYFLMQLSAALVSEDENLV